jgi:hypothetical protein
MPHPNEETVRRAYAAVNARNVEGFIDEFATMPSGDRAGTLTSGQSVIASDGEEYRRRADDLGRTVEETRLLRRHVDQP